ncbi:MAG: InlB B-repeat-containing protein [Lachnospiraceae bacterium]|nr:InlB B-repeat-containing protein [Lachnospiraceae bacterium]
MKKNDKFGPLRPWLTIPATVLISAVMAMSVRADSGTQVCVSNARGRIVAKGSVIYDSEDIKRLGEAVEAQANEIVSFKEGMINGVRNIGLEKDGGIAPYKSPESIDQNTSPSDICAAIRGSQAIRDEDRTVSGSRYIHGKFSDTNGMIYDSSMISEGAGPWTTRVYRASADDLPLGAVAYMDGEYLVGTGLALDAAYATGLGSVTGNFKNISVDPDGGAFIYPLSEGSSATEDPGGIRTFYADHDYEDIGSGFSLEKKNVDTGTGFLRDYRQNGWKISVSEGSPGEAGTLLFRPSWEDINYTLTIRMGPASRTLSLAYGETCDLEETTTWTAGSTDDADGKRTLRGWLVSSGDAQLSSGSIITMGKGSSTVDALWDDWSTLTVDMNGHGAYNGSTPSGTACKWGTTVSLGIPEAVPGWTFTGWAVKDDSGKECKTDGSGIFTMPGQFGDHRSVTATALWKARTYTVKFHPNKGQGSMPDQLFTIGSYQALPESTFTRTGCSFAGWSLTPGGEKAFENRQSVKDLTTEGGSVTDLYAKWKLNTYKLTVTADSGASSTDISWPEGIYDETLTEQIEPGDLKRVFKAENVPYGASVTIVSNLNVGNSYEYVLEAIDGKNDETLERGYTLSMPASDRDVTLMSVKVPFAVGKYFFKYKLRGAESDKWNYSGCLCLAGDHNAEKTSLKNTVVSGGTGAGWYFLACADDNGPVIPGTVRTFNCNGTFVAYYEGSDGDRYLNNEFLNSMSPRLIDAIAESPIAMYKASMRDNPADSMPTTTIDKGKYGQDDSGCYDGAPDTEGNYSGVYKRKIFVPSSIEIIKYSPTAGQGLRSTWDPSSGAGDERTGWVVRTGVYLRGEFIWYRTHNGLWDYKLSDNTGLGMRPAFCISAG